MTDKASSTTQKKRSKDPVPHITKASYVSLPVSYPDSFLGPLPNPSTIKVNKINFARTVLPEYESLYAVILDDVLSQEECQELIRYAEMSAGAHTKGIEVENNGWQAARVNIGNNLEMLSPDYRNSDRIIWDDHEVTRRLWARILQAKGMRDYLLRLQGEEYAEVLGYRREKKDECWVATKQGVNERMRFLKYGAGQFFRPHCDAAYTTPDRTQTSFFTIHLYLNDSAKALGVPEPAKGSTDPRLVDSEEKPAELLRGGATTFHSHGYNKRLDVDPKAGRVLIFQHEKLLHSGDDVLAGVKYTMRSDLQYEREQRK